MPYKKCCNPFATHGKVTSDVRHPTNDELSQFQVKLINTVKKTSFLCRQCREKIKTYQPDSSLAALNAHTVSGTPEMPMEVSPQFSSSSSTSKVTVTPASDEHTKQQHNADQIIELAKHFGLDVPDKKKIDVSSASFSLAATQDLYFSMINNIKSLFPTSVTNATENFEKVLDKLKSEFENADSVQKKIEILKLLPESWTYEKIMSNFEGATDYMIKSVKVEKNLVFGISPLPQGRKSIEQSIKKKVIQFYFEDDVSRPFPGRKDFLSVKLKNGKRKKEQKRLLLAPINLLHEKYLKQCAPNEKVSLSLFTSLRPKQCVFAKDPSAANICVCMIHENTDLIIQGLKDTRNFPNLTKQELLQTLVEKMLCPVPDTACYLQQCTNCDEQKMLDYVAQILDANNVNDVSFSMWVTSPKCEITFVTDDADIFMDRLKKQLKRFILHKFKVDKQFEFIKNIKRTLKANKYFLIQLDFAENYTCIYQNSIQSHYFGAPTVTIHPFVVFFKTSETSEIQTLSIVAISEVKTHNTVTVYTFQKKLIEILKEKFPEIEKILYLSDGSGEQYKNKSNIKNLCCHQLDFDISAEWHFFPTAHGKGPCDGIGGCLKRMAKEASLRKVPINSAKQFYEWATSSDAKKQFKKDWNFMFVSQQEFNASEAELKDRFADLKIITGTKSFHQFIPLNENEVSASEFSGSDTLLTFSLSDSNKRKPQTNDDQRRSKRQRKNIDYVE